MKRVVNDSLNKHQLGPLKNSMRHQSNPRPRLYDNLIKKTSMPSVDAMGCEGGALSPSQRYRENNFNLEGLHKLDSISKFRIDYKSPIPSTLLQPLQAANKYYDKHPALALDKIR